MLLDIKKLKLLTMVLSAVLAALLLVVFVICLDGLQLFKKESPVKEMVSIEAGSGSLGADCFIKDMESDVELLTDLSIIDLSTVGKYDILFSDKDGTYKSTLSVVDTVAPTAMAVDKQIYDDESVNASDLVTDIVDISEVTVSFKTQPEFGKLGQQDVVISLVDAQGNEGTVTAKLNIIKDVVPPVFSAMEPISVMVGNTVSYKNGITATDDRDGMISFTVDSSSVDLSKVGTYEVTYTATDKGGNTTSIKRKINVTNKLIIDRAMVDSIGKGILDKIITPDMTDHQKIDTIFKWVRKNMTYVSSPEKDIPNAAYVGFKKKRGDCYNYYAMTTVLLDGCGIQNQKIERYGGSSSHIWLLVNIGNGWYHYDTTPQHHLYPFTCFMKTDAEVWAYAKSRGDGRADYYNFKADLYPARSTTTYTAP